MARILNSTLAFLLLLAPVLHGLGQGGSSCEPSGIGALQFRVGLADTPCCLAKEDDPSTPSLSPACRSGHQCCALDAPLQRQTLAIIENRSLPSADLKAVVEPKPAPFFVQTKPSDLAASLLRQLPTTNALRCSLIQRWRI